MGRIGAVARYYTYKATKAVELYRPIMYLYFSGPGELSFFQITILEAVYNLTTVLGEVPTGYLSDRIGRRNGLVLGTVLIAGTLFGLAQASSFPQFLVLYSLWSLGYTFRSGSEDAWLYDSLAGDGRSFTDVRGTGESVALATGVVAAVVGGYLGGIDLTYPFIAAAGVTALGALVLLTVDDSGSAPDQTTLSATLRAVRTAFADRRMRSFIVLYYVLFSAVTYLTFIFLQPRLETVAAGFGVADDVESLLGWYYAAISLTSALFTYRAEWIRERVGMSRWFLLVPLAVGLLLVGQWLVPVVAVGAFLLVRGLAEATRVFASQYVNDHIDSLGRATVLSAMSMVSGLTVIPFQLGSGALSDALSPGFALGVAGGVLVAGTLGVFLWRTPVNDEQRQPTAAED